MCNQCPTVGEFLCSILRGVRSNHTCCKHSCNEYHTNTCNNKCEHKHECEEKRYECFCREKREHAACEKPEREHAKTDCCCKFF